MARPNARKHPLNLKAAPTPRVREPEPVAAVETPAPAPAPKSYLNERALLRAYANGDKSVVPSLMTFNAYKNFQDPDAAIEVIEMDAKQVAADDARASAKLALSMMPTNALLLKNHHTMVTTEAEPYFQELFRRAPYSKMTEADAREAADTDGHKLDLERRVQEREATENAAPEPTPAEVIATGPHSHLSEVSTDDLLMGYVQSDDAEYLEACRKELRAREPYSTMTVDEDQFVNRIVLAGAALLDAVEEAKPEEIEATGRFGDLSEFPTDELLDRLVDSLDDDYDAALVEELRTREPYRTEYANRSDTELKLQLLADGEALLAATDEPATDLSQEPTDALLLSYAETTDDEYETRCEEELLTREPFNRYEDVEAAKDAMMERGNELLSKSVKEEFDAAEAAELAAMSASPKKATATPVSKTKAAPEAKPSRAEKAKAARDAKKAQPVAEAEAAAPASPSTPSSPTSPLTPSEGDEGHEGDEGDRGDTPAGVIMSDYPQDDNDAEGDEGDDGDEAEAEEPGAYENLREFTFRYLDRRRIKVLLDGKIARKDSVVPFDYDTDQQHAGAQVLTRATLKDELADAALVQGLKIGNLDLAMRLWTNKSRLERSVELWSTLTTRTPDPKPFFEKVMRMAEVRFPNEDPKYVAAVFEEIVWQTKRKMRLLEVKYPFFFILWSEKQGGGKSHLSKMLASPLQEAARKRVTVKQIVSGEKAAKMWESNILIVDDMDKTDPAAMGSLKSIVTGDEFSHRPMQTNDFESQPNVTTLIGSCDQPVMNIIADPRGMRRFVDLRHTDLKARHNPRGRELTDAVFDPSVAHLYWQAIDHRRDSPIDEHEFTDHLEERQEAITPAKQMSSFEMWLSRLDFAALPNKVGGGFAHTQTLHEDYQIALDTLRRRDVMSLVPFGRELGAISFKEQEVQEPHHRFFRKQVGGKTAYQPVEPLTD